MFPTAKRNPKTIAAYECETSRLVAQYQRENPNDAPGAPLVQTAHWFLNSHARWAGNTIRLYANALEQVIGSMLEDDTFDPDSQEAVLLRRLKNDRPSSVGKSKKSEKAKLVAHQQKVAAKKKKRKKPRKSIPVSELRELIRYFRSRDDEFSLWIVGYIILATRIGWRPGEMLIVQREGYLLRAVAEKHTNGRGLKDNCEIDLSAYFEKSRLFKSVSLISELDKWIADIHKWETYYGGLSMLRDNINSRLATACENREIKRVCTYTFRHFAISCLKASGFSRAEIAVIVNHGNDRTAGEHYGRRRHGFKRARKMLRFDQARLPLVRATARKFDRSAALSAKDLKLELPEHLITLGDEIDSNQQCFRVG
jgi:integrase